MPHTIDWKDVENKIAIICYKFDNLASWREDLAQELRIHAYYVSDNYYDLYRRAIDFWRMIQTKQSPETAYYDLEVLSPSYTEDFDDQSKEIVRLIKDELNRYGHTKWDEDKITVARMLLDIIISDIDDKAPEIIPSKSPAENHYMTHRLNLSWVEQETGINYKKLVNSMRILEEVIQGLAMMHKIDIPSFYLRDYFDRS